MRISDWSSDVCSSDLAGERRRVADLEAGFEDGAGLGVLDVIGKFKGNFDGVVRAVDLVIGLLQTGEFGHEILAARRRHAVVALHERRVAADRKSTRLNSSH